MIEILFDNSEDRRYDPLEIETGDPKRMYIDQIKMALESDLGSIMGADVTISLEQYLFEQNLDEITISAKIRQILGNFCSFYEDFETEISVNFAQGELRDICLIVIKVNGDGAYKLLLK